MNYRGKHVVVNNVITCARKRPFAELGATVRGRKLAPDVGPRKKLRWTFPLSNYYNTSGIALDRVVHIVTLPRINGAFHADTNLKKIYEKKSTRLRSGSRSDVLTKIVFRVAENISNCVAVALCVLYFGLIFIYFFFFRELNA